MTPTLSSSRPTLPLTMAIPGETVELVDIQLERTEKQRLRELGLLPGSSLRVIKSDPTHGLIVAVRQDGRLALNRSTAHKLLVCLIG
ncbi:MAG: ferrous iron transport protein A [Chloroflexi bacterium]|nr:ferrous iron transport protein A [Chloroflexota bacterium]